MTYSEANALCRTHEADTRETLHALVPARRGGWIAVFLRDGGPTGPAVIREPHAKGLGGYPCGGGSYYDSADRALGAALSTALRRPR